MLLSSEPPPVIAAPMETLLQFSSPINAARPCMASLTLLLMGPGTWHKDKVEEQWEDMRNIEDIYIYILK